MKKITNFLKAKAITAQATIVSKSGEGFVDTGVKIIISVVIGALILAALYALLGTTVMPEVTQKVGGLFDYVG